MYVNFTMSAADLVTLRQSRNVALAGISDTKVRVTLPNGADYGETGTLDFSDIAVNPTTGAVSLRALLPRNPPARSAAGHVRDARGNPRAARNQVYLIPAAGAPA